MRWAGIALALSIGSGAQGQEHASVRVPFDDAFGLVWVAVSVGAADTLSFILDTGFEYSLINASVAKQLGLDVAEPRLVPQPGGAVEVGAVADVALRIGGVRVAPLTLQAVPLGGLEPVVGRRLDGVIGHDVIEQYVLTIDYDRRTLIVQPSAGGILPAGDTLALTIIANEPFVDGVIRQPHDSAIRGRFKLDTGSLDAAGLNRGFLEDAGVLAPGQRTRTIPGVAVGGETDGLLFGVDGFRLGRFEIRHAVIGATLESAGFENRSDAGTIGAEILRRFTVTLDYAGSRMVLVPGAQFDDPPAVDRSGMWVVAAGSDFTEFRVRFVLDGGPAAAAGVRQGDVVVSVNGRPATEMRLVDLWRLSRQPDGTIVTLDLQRGAERRSARVVLRSPV
ncbi:MAG: aspartyl protease family protein [Gemmatimonadota bacterium]|nr:aspartyl protease family protein [Gemmatimonadota bacterium]MDH5197184.1 aspartyl protease family protein [Gemmatimonadota bacterium]